MLYNQHCHSTNCQSQCLVPGSCSHGPTSRWLCSSLEHLHDNFSFLFKRFGSFLFVLFAFWDRVSLCSPSWLAWNVPRRQSDLNSQAVYLPPTCTPCSVRLLCLCVCMRAHAMCVPGAGAAGGCELSENQTCSLQEPLALESALGLPPFDLPSH